MSKPEQVWETCDLQVCEDCLMYIANGDFPHDDDDGSIERTIKAGEKNWLAEGYRLSAGDSDKDDGFSWSSCDCCDRGLGGHRHHVVGLKRLDGK